MNGYDNNGESIGAHQYCKKLVAITSSSSKSSLGCAAFLLAPWEFVRFDRGAGLDGRAWAGSGLLEWVDERFVLCMAIGMTERR